MEKINIEIEGEYIKLDQLLKYSSVVQSGAEAKILIMDGYVKVNGEIELRRGRKVNKGDLVNFSNDILISVE